MPEKQAESTTGLRVLAMLMAVVLWGFVGISQHHLMLEVAQRRFAIGIEIKHAPPTMRLQLEPALAEVLVEGAAKEVGHLSDADLSAFVDLRFRYPLAERIPIHVSVPGGMRYQVSPEYAKAIVIPDLRVDDGDRK
ncbi:MAG: hypothetical protein HY692_00890 [Cyanobacteria bacterium NC_groundwater_1444_Ag_S-0.65um_54_12]|nr:hypothetical protein [Cyanobacteria bacterium NC_groundwater_1444_Ag_S-0.65um_54_12]